MSKPIVPLQCSAFIGDRGKLKLSRKRGRSGGNQGNANGVPICQSVSHSQSECCCIPSPIFPCSIKSQVLALAVLYLFDFGTESADDQRENGQFPVFFAVRGKCLATADWNRLSIHQISGTKRYLTLFLYSA